jgi:hypothetical protein
VTADHAVTGFVHAIEWIDGTLVDGGTGTITCTQTPSGVDTTICTLANPLINADKWYFPREQVHSNAGAALTLEGTEPAYDRPIACGVLKLVISAGGATKEGGCIVWLEE